jgi:hypothetical protein
VQSVFHNWMNRPAWVFENGGEYIIEWIRNNVLVCCESQNRRGPGTFFAPRHLLMSADGTEGSCFVHRIR